MDALIVLIAILSFIVMFDAVSARDTGGRQV
jgi:acid phosphatase family membrane protein YuiD